LRIGYADSVHSIAAAPQPDADQTARCHTCLSHIGFGETPVEDEAPRRDAAGVSRACSVANGTRVPGVVAFSAAGVHAGDCCSTASDGAAVGPTFGTTSGGLAPGTARRLKLSPPMDAEACNVLVVGSAACNVLVVGSAACNVLVVGSAAIGGR
jgi:hypothetical protein